MPGIKANDTTTAAQSDILRAGGNVLCWPKRAGIGNVRRANFPVGKCPGEYDQGEYPTPQSSTATSRHRSVRSQSCRTRVDDAAPTRSVVNGDVNGCGSKYISVVFHQRCFY